MEDPKLFWSFRKYINIYFNSNLYRFESDREALRNIIIPLCSGNLRSIGKRNQFNLWVENHFEDLICQESLSSAPINKDWLVGFTDGDGSFYPMIHKASDYRCGLIFIRGPKSVDGTHLLIFLVLRKSFGLSPDY